MILLIILFTINVFSTQAQYDKPTHVSTAPAYFDIFTKPTISFNYNSTMFCYSETIGSVTLNNVETGAKTSFSLGKESTIVVCQFHPKKDLILIGCKDGSITLYDYKEQKIVKTLIAHKKSITAVTYSTNGDTLYTAGKDDIINVWAESGDLIKTFETASSAKTIHIRGKKVIYNNEKMMNCVRIIDYTTAKEKKIDVSTAMKMDVSKDGKRAYVNCLSSEVEVWNLESGFMEYKLIGHTGHGEDVVLSGNEKMLISGGDDNIIVVWDVVRQKKCWTIDMLKDIYCICISPDDKYFVVLTNAQETHLFKTNITDY